MEIDTFGRVKLVDDREIGLANVVLSWAAPQFAEVVLPNTIKDQGKHLTKKQSDALIEGLHTKFGDLYEGQMSVSHAWELANTELDGMVGIPD